MVRKTAPEKRLLNAAAELQSFCEGRRWQACLIGGLAVLRWGRPRATRDVDFSLWTGLGEEAKLNWQQIEQELAPLCELKEAPEILDRLRRLCEDLAGE